MAHYSVRCHYVLDLIAWLVISLSFPYEVYSFLKRRVLTRNKKRTRCHDDNTLTAEAVSRSFKAEFKSSSSAAGCCGND